MKTILYCGHLSNFGLWSTTSLLDESFFNITTIVLGKIDLWESFYNRLDPGSIKKNNRHFKKRYQQQLKKLNKIIGARKIKVIYTSDANDPKDFQVIDDYDLMICSAFPQIFSSAFLDLAKERAYNFHPSFLPRCRGANPIYWTIASGEPHGGISCHLLTKKLDRGAIAAREKIDFDPKTITYEVLSKKIETQLPSLVSQLKDFFLEEKAAITQNNLEANFFSENLKIHKKIYWQQENYAEISAKIRAGSAFTLYKGKEIKLIPPVNFQTSSKYVTNQYQEKIPPGIIVYVQDTEIIIKLKDGYLHTNLPPTPNNFRAKLVRLYRNIKRIFSPFAPTAGEIFR